MSGLDAERLFEQALQHGVSRDVTEIVEDMLGPQVNDNPLYDAMESQNPAQTSQNALAALRIVNEIRKKG